MNREQEQDWFMFACSHMAMFAWDIWRRRSRTGSCAHVRISPCSHGTFGGGGGGAGTGVGIGSGLRIRTGIGSRYK